MADPSIAGQDEVYFTKDGSKGKNGVIVDGPEGKFTFFRDNLKQALEQLHDKRFSSVDDLSPVEREKFVNVVESLKMIQSTPDVYTSVMREVNEMYRDEKVVPGTIGSFLIGCFNDDKLDISPGCNPKCTASLPRDPTSEDNCEDLVLIYNGKLNSLNDKRSEHAYIYIESEKFLGFDQRQIDQLTEAGVREVTLIESDSTGKYKELREPQMVNALVARRQNETEEKNRSLQITLTVIIACACALLLWLLSNVMQR